MTRHSFKEAQRYGTEFELMSESTWHILGRGSIGLLWADALSQQDLDVNLLVRDAHPQTRQTIELTSPTGERSRFDTTLDDSEAVSVIDNLVVPLKAYDVEPAVSRLRHRIDQHTLIVLCHNGMGTIEPLRKMLGQSQPMVFATTTHGAYRPAPYQVVHTGLGETKMGWVSDRRKRSALAVLDQVLPPVSWHDDIERILWLKLAINCVINPLSAIEQCQNGQLALPKYRDTIVSLCREISCVATACGVALTEQQILDSSYKVIQDTANNLSSMNRDIAQRRRTEIDFITGYLLQKALAAGIDIPTNQRLYHHVKQLEAS